MWSWSFSLDLSDVCGILMGLCDFYPFYRFIIFCLGLFLWYLNVLLICSCSAYAIHLFSQCSRVLDSALVHQTEISCLFQWIFTTCMMITTCLELLSQTKIYYSWMLLFSHLWWVIFIFNFFIQVFHSVLVLVGDCTQA